MLSEKHDDSPSRSQFYFAPFSREAGVYIHEILEAQIKGLPAPVWEDSYQRGDLNRFQEVGELAKISAQKLIRSQLWQDLIRPHKCEAELPIVHLNGDKLVRGNIDLVVEIDKDRILLIDYKTVPVGDDESLKTKYMKSNITNKYWPMYQR